MRSRTVLIIGFLALAACREQALDTSDWPRVNAAGLSIAIPPGYRETAAAPLTMPPGYEIAGYIDTVAGGVIMSLSTPLDRRTIDRIDVGFQETTLRTGPMSTPVVVRSGTSPEPYKIYNTGGGSGGIEYVLKTSTMLGSRRIYITAEKQREYIPSFPEAWAVIDSIRKVD